jgi:hypothetical protein
MESGSIGCVGLPEAVYALHAKVYPKEPTPKSKSTPGKPVSYFFGILHGLGKTPKDYMDNPTVIPIAQGVLDPDDGRSWDWYIAWCPTGPPCDFLAALSAITSR